MFTYQKLLLYPVHVTKPDPKLASFILGQYCGPDGDFYSATKYLSQRYTMPFPEATALLTDIGLEELDHMEIMGTLLYQLTHNLSEDEIRACPNEAFFTQQPMSAMQSPWRAGFMESTSSAMAILTDNLASEQRAHLAFENILRVSEHEEVNRVIRFLREREIVHFQRFGECLRLLQERKKPQTPYLLP